MYKVLQSFGGEATETAGLAEAGKSWPRTGAEDQTYRKELEWLGVNIV